MIILPAIDILDGKCVRLVKGAYDSSSVVAEDIFATARGFRDAGANWLHMVDLNGAKKGEAVNFDLIREVAHESCLNVEIGGGIRDVKTAERYLAAGVARVILGSAALKNPALVTDCLAAFTAERVVVGIDALNGFVATEGWTEASKVHYIELAKIMEDKGVKTIIFTDISKDGTLAGANIEMLKYLKEAVSCNIVASGGVRDMTDIKALKALNVYGAICGKSLYQGTLSLVEAINYCK